MLSMSERWYVNSTGIRNKPSEWQTWRYKTPVSGEIEPGYLHNGRYIYISMHWQKFMSPAFLTSWACEVMIVYVCVNNQVNAGGSHSSLKENSITRALMQRDALLAHRACTFVSRIQVSQTQFFSSQQTCMYYMITEDIPSRLPASFFFLLYFHSRLRTGSKCHKLPLLPHVDSDWPR